LISRSYPFKGVDFLVALDRRRFLEDAALPGYSTTQRLDYSTNNGSMNTGGSACECRYVVYNYNTMPTTLSDTAPASERLQIELMRQAPPWRKVYLAGQMTETVRLLAISGLRQRHPQATPAELQRLLADLWLGPELAARVYDPTPEKSGHAT